MKEKHVTGFSEEPSLSEPSPHQPSAYIVPPMDQIPEGWAATQVDPETIEYRTSKRWSVMVFFDSENGKYCVHSAGPSPVGDNGRLYKSRLDTVVAANTVAVDMMSQFSPSGLQASAFVYEEDAGLIESAGGYLHVLHSRSLRDQFDDLLEPAVNNRIFGIRNALRELGWTGELYKELSKNGVRLEMKCITNTGGFNTVGFYMNGRLDDFSLSPEDFAARIDAESLSTTLEDSSEDDLSCGLKM